MLSIYVALRNHIADAVRREEGQGMVEYALILALIAVVSILILQALGLEVFDIFNSSEDNMQKGTPKANT